MFDTINGLPVHALVVHAVVVLLPLMALVTFLVAARASWRPAAGWVFAANVVVLAMTFTARQSGQTLRNRLGGQVAADHASKGTILPLFALALVVVSLLLVAVRKRSGVAVAITVGLAAAVGLAAIGWTVVVGDSGARAVWEGRVPNTGG